jgi:hypothetical protein
MAKAAAAEAGVSILLRMRIDFESIGILLDGA